MYSSDAFTPYIPYMFYALRKVMLSLREKNVMDTMLSLCKFYCKKYNLMCSNLVQVSDKYRIQNIKIKVRGTFKEEQTHRSHRIVMLKTWLDCAPTHLGAPDFTLYPHASSTCQSVSCTPSPQITSYSPLPFIGSSLSPSPYTATHAIGQIYCRCWPWVLLSLRV